jgi:[ribosomal protein S5]-alanine N-acetyltransferase
MIFESERLAMRLWTLDDFDDYYALYSDPEVLRYIQAVPKPPDPPEVIRELLVQRVEKQASWPEGQGSWAIVEKDSGRAVGTVIFRPVPEGPEGDFEIGWHLARAFWGRGYATEAARAAMEYGFEKNPSLDRIISVCFPENTPSERVMQRIGMHPKGLSDLYFSRTLTLYEITREQARINP